MARRANIKEQSAERRHKLEESRKLQQFERDADEVKAWINEKLKIACDESYKVPGDDYRNVNIISVVFYLVLYF